jgi:hypothetical protein
MGATGRKLKGKVLKRLTTYGQSILCSLAGLVEDGGRIS